MLLELVLDKRDTVRERLAEVIAEIGTHKLDLLSEESWQKLALFGLDRKERYRACLQRKRFSICIFQSSGNGDQVARQHLRETLQEKRRIV